jgi:hypothetical protein
LEKILAGSEQIDEGNLSLALAGMALQEDRFGSKQAAEKYSDRAVQVLRPQAGLDREVETLFHYLRYVMVSPITTTIAADAQRWLITFLRGADELMGKHSTVTYLSAVPLRRDAFRMEGPLFPVLSSGPRPSQVPHNSRMYVVRGAPTQDMCRTAALIYITAALWDFQDSPNKTSRFLAYLCGLVQEHRLDRDLATESLVWLLLNEGQDADLRDPERAWSTGELLKTHKQLRPDLHFQFNEILMSFLLMTPPPRIRGIDVFEEELHRSQSVTPG